MRTPARRAVAAVRGVRIGRVDIAPAATHGPHTPATPKAAFAADDDVGTARASAARIPPCGSLKRVLLASPQEIAGGPQIKKRLVAAYRNTSVLRQGRAPATGFSRRYTVSGCSTWLARAYSLGKRHR